MPDIFVPQDTVGVTSYLIEVSKKGLLLQYSFLYTDNNRQKLMKYENGESLLAYLKSQHVLEQFLAFADKKGVKRRNILIHKSQDLLERYLYGNIIYNMLGREEHIRFINKADETVQKALEVLKNGEAFPTIPQTNPNQSES